MADARPWLRFYGGVPATLSYPDATLYQTLAGTAQRVPGAVAWDFFDTTQTYREFLASIDACANALAALGLQAGERVLISMPTAPQGAMRTGDAAAILFSGGTTGLPKGILLSNRNFIAEGMQAAAWGGIREGDSILAILPIFHGFGLGVCVNAAFMSGGKSILVPVFSARTVAQLLRKKRPNLLVREHRERHG